MCSECSIEAVREEHRARERETAGTPASAGKPETRVAPIENDRFDARWALDALGGRDLEALLPERIAWLGDRPIKWVDDDVIEDAYDGDGVTTALSLIWAMRQQEANPFADEMQAILARGSALSVAQVRGLWNVIRAAEQRDQEDRVHAYLNHGQAPRFGGIATLMAELGERVGRAKIALPREDGKTVWLSVAGERARFPGSINVTNSRRFGGSWHGRIVDGVPDVQLSRDDAVLAVLDTLETDPSVANAVTSHARATGACMVCGRELTRIESIERGIGPICAEKAGI